MRPSYPYIVPTLLAAVAWCVTVWLAVKLPSRRKAAVSAAVVLFLFGAFGTLKTQATRYKWNCITHHADYCNGDGDDPGVGGFDKWLADHLAD